MGLVTHESIKREAKPIETTTNDMKNIVFSTSRKGINKGAWTAEEDRKLAEVIEIHAARRWKSVAAKAGLNRSGKSCRLRWLNYLRPNIKRGNISDQEEDLILRLHKLLGNRWSLIAGRLQGRTDNEIKNYWNSHLSKKTSEREKQSGSSKKDGESKAEKRTTNHNKLTSEVTSEENTSNSMNINNEDIQDLNTSFNVDEFFDFSNEDPLNLEWITHFLEIDKSLISSSGISEDS